LFRSCSGCPLYLFRLRCAPPQKDAASIRARAAVFKIMFMQTPIIRKIQPNDNLQIAEVIRKVLIELAVPKEGTAYADPQLDKMFETYNVPSAAYFVVDRNGKVLGGAGIGPLDKEPETCELQKMYFLPETRGLGLGEKMIRKCLQFAKESGYKKCYLETMPNMKAAQKLYKKLGFEYLCEPLGDTGHTSCPVWMIKTIDT